MAKTAQDILSGKPLADVAKRLAATAPLPITVVQGSNPRRFRWRHMAQLCEGTLPLGVDYNVEALINIATARGQEIESLMKDVQFLKSKLAEHKPEAQLAKK